jgi:hypothetical protein
VQQTQDPVPGADEEVWHLEGTAEPSAHVDQGLRRARGDKTHPWAAQNAETRAAFSPDCSVGNLLSPRTVRSVQLWGVVGDASGIDVIRPSQSSPTTPSPQDHPGRNDHVIDSLATPEVAFLVVAATVAGAIGTAGGTTSLISFPALLVVGVPPWDANIANLMAAVVCWPASAAVSQAELRAVRDQLPRGLVAAVAGAALGTSLLLVTPPATFDVVVPFLVAAGSVVLLASPRLTQQGAGGSTA